MNRAAFPKKAAMGTAGMALATSAPAANIARGRTGRPNVLLIMTDDQPHYAVRRMQNPLSLVGGMGATFERGYLTTSQRASEGVLPHGLARLKPRHPREPERRRRCLPGRRGCVVK